MRISDLSLPRFMLLHICLFLIPIAAWPQAPPPQSRIVARVNENVLVTLRGNTHPLAQPQFDQGAAPPDLPMARMLLVLKRSAAQEAALQTLLDDQQDRNSPSYHQWLTPDAFGQQFGPSDQDMQVVATWLISHGFQIGGVSLGRTVIEFSGTVSQVQQAFHTEIHKYTANGADHWANTNDPQIPAALSPVVEGINSLHNFPKQPMYRFAGKVSKSGNAGGAQALGPDFTTPYFHCAISGNCYFVGPYDLAKIYNLLPLWNATPAIDGTGQSIAIVNESNINIQDVRDFRNIFGLTPNDPQIILNGTDPGLVPGVESEADLDVEWSGAVAKGATIKLVVTAPTNATAGVDLSAVYAVENNVAPIISESFGECELFLGNAGNSFQSGIRQQAAAQGITFINSSGDEGSARCDPYSGSLPDPATHGLAVSGLASSPYGVAVGGTDFQNFGANFTVGVPSPYWSLTNDSQQASALGYIPETTWNSTCTNIVFVLLGDGANPEASCNNARIEDYFVDTEAGGGGKSSCTTSNGSAPSDCSGGYGKPSWQTAPGVPADGARDIPDVSLFASPGFMDSSYIICESDQLPFPQPCSLNSPFNTFLGIGGTSASAPAFAGIVALVNQFTGASGQGNANYVLYKMAASSAQTSRACGATSNPSAGCIFYDVTSGTNAVPCAKGSPNCNVSSASDLYGVLSGYNATAGYDLTTGLGSVNASNLVHNWIQPTDSSSTTLSLNGGAKVNITHGQNVTFSIAVTPSAAPGVVSLMGSPSGGSFVPLASFPLQNGAVSGTTASLAGGNSYAVKAYYPGTGTFTPSDSAPVTVTVAPEPSKTLITLPTFDPNTGNETGNTPTSVVYGTPLGVRVDVGNEQASQTFPERLVCAPLACPTGSVTLTDTVNGSTTTLSPAGGFALSNGGFAEDDAVSVFSGGTHQLKSTYSGDNSYGSSSDKSSIPGGYTLAVTPAPTQMSGPYGFYSLPGIVGTPVQISANASATSAFSGAAPTGTITFDDGETLIAGTVTYSAVSGYRGGYPSMLTGTIATAFTTTGTHQISTTYSGDANYAAATASANISVVFSTSATLTPNVTTINLGQSASVTATVTGASKTPPMTGTLQFSSMPNAVAGTPGTDANGNQTLSATVTFTPQSSQAINVTYSGDANYASAVAFTFVSVNLPDFSVSTGSPSLTITAGQTGTTTLTVTPVNNVPGAVALACNSLQTMNVTCSFNPPSPLNLTNGNAVTTTLSIATMAPSSSPTTQLVLPRPPRSKWLPPPGLWLLAVADGLAILFLTLSGGRKRRFAAALGMAGMLCLVLSCGSNVGSTGTVEGGGGGGPVPTSITLTTSSLKVQSGVNFTLTATVKSGNSPTGWVNFFDSGQGLSTATVMNGVATTQIFIQLIGTHVLTAQYIGDSKNQASQTNGSISQVITGTAQMSVNGTGTVTGLSHFATLNVTIQ